MLNNVQILELDYDDDDDDDDDVNNVNIKSWILGAGSR